jgi:hypothetical protein
MISARFKNRSSTKQKAFWSVPKLAEWISFCSFLELPEMDSIQMISLSWTFSRETPWNGLFELMNAFPTSNIIPVNKRTYSLSFSKLTTAFQELKNQF